MIDRRDGMQDFYARRVPPPKTEGNWLKNFQYVPDERPVWHRRGPGVAYILGFLWILIAGVRIVVADGFSLWDAALMVYGAAGVMELWAEFRKWGASPTRRRLFLASLATVVVTFLYIFITRT